MRMLEISPAAKKKAQKVVAHAKKKANWYDPSVPGWMNRVPGFDKRHCCRLNSFKCVFSYTVDRNAGTVLRHLSISVPSKSFPNPVAVREIAKMFGFTGADEEVSANFPSDWQIRMNRDHPIDDDCIVVGQETGIKP